MNDLTSQIAKIVEENGYSLYDIEILKENDSNIFRVSIANIRDNNSKIDSKDSKNKILESKIDSKDSPDSKISITLEDCKKISEIISPLLDVYNPIDGEYFLEVSSPGLERVLKKPNHFRLSTGDKIQVTLLDKTKLSGILGSSDESGFYLDKQYIKYSDIKKAKSIFEW